MRTFFLFSVLTAGLLGFSGLALADATIVNGDSAQRTVYVECATDAKGNNYLDPNDVLVFPKADLDAAEHGCIVKMGSTGINLYDGGEYRIVNGKFERQ